MAKIKTTYRCSECNHSSSKWIGCCPDCGAWNSFQESNEKIFQSGKISKAARAIKAKEPIILKGFSDDYSRISTNISEFDRVVGEGLVPGSLTLLSGEPGIGKSTLTLQLGANLAKQGKTLLVSGEESINQIANRAARLKLEIDNLVAINEYNLETILETVKAERPKCLIIDSVQVISSMDIDSSAGSISQVRYCTEQVMELIKQLHIPTILIGHVTKDGNIAGPRVLEHLVDTVLQLEGDRFHQFRLLKSCKNRFGSCGEVGIFSMEEQGLIEVKNPSAQFLSEHEENRIGSCIGVAMEGNRPFLVEVQALVSPTHFGYPKRTANGFDLNRLQILIAAIEKYCGLQLQTQDVFINVVGGIKLQEPASDLAVALAIASSLLKKALPNGVAAFGEIGLSGELRKVSHSEKRNKEANRLGMERCISGDQHKNLSDALKILHSK